jgi:hypothetical protein
MLILVHKYSASFNGHLAIDFVTFKLDRRGLEEIV